MAIVRFRMLLLVVVSMSMRESGVSAAREHSQREPHIKMNVEHIVHASVAGAPHDPASDTPVDVDRTSEREMPSAHSRMSLIETASANEVASSSSAGNKLSGSSLAAMSGAEQAPPQEIGQKIVTCDVVAGEMKCTYMSGSDLGPFRVPEGEEPYAPWLGEQVVKAVNDPSAQVHLATTTGEIFWSQQFRITDLQKDGLRCLAAVDGSFSVKARGKEFTLAKKAGEPLFAHYNCERDQPQRCMWVIETQEAMRHWLSDCVIEVTLGSSCEHFKVLAQEFGKTAASVERC